MRYALLAIGEASRHLEGQASALCPDIPWASIRGLGNWLRHGHDRIVPAVLWQTVTKAVVRQNSGGRLPLHLTWIRAPRAAARRPSSP